eukprot:scaffold174109_cov30-Tisochrysis_lutea.AAC.5
MLVAFTGQLLPCGTAILTASAFLVMFSLEAPRPIGSSAALVLAARRCSSMASAICAMVRNLNSAVPDNGMWNALLSSEAKVLARSEDPPHKKKSSSLDARVSSSRPRTFIQNCCTSFSVAVDGGE